jgi:hypothetical protein
MNTEPIDIADRSAFAVWLVALYHHVTAVTAIGFDVTAMEHHQLYLDMERAKLARANDAISRMFARVATVLQEWGAFDPKRPTVTAEMRRQVAHVRAQTAHLPRVEKVSVTLYLRPADLARVDRLIRRPFGWGLRREVLAVILMYGLPIAEAEHIARMRWPGPDPSHKEERAAFEARFVRRRPKRKGGAS